MQSLRLLLVIIRLKDHQPDKAPGQNDHNAHSAQKNDQEFLLIICPVAHKKPHKSLSTIYERFCERQDYRYKDHFHYIYNEMTKEISIMIINPYQITLKCDRISNVLVQTLKEANHCFRIFRHDKCYEEVVI